MVDREGPTVSANSPPDHAGVIAPAPVIYGTAFVIGVHPFRISVQWSDSRCPARRGNVRTPGRRSAATVTLVRSLAMFVTRVTLRTAMASVTSD
jgi:hypothetical protein